MTDSPEFDAERLTDYLAGEGSPEERAAVEQWMAAKASRTTAVFRRQAMWRALRHREKPEFDLQALDQAILAHATARGRPSVTAGHRTRRTVWRPGWQWGSTAAAIVVVLVVAFAVPKFQRHVVNIPEHIYKTATGQRATVTLGDGTQVSLAPQTTLTISRGFGTDSRSVRVSGEAMFAVAHISGIPFTVQSGDAVTRVLGTTFIVRKYRDDPVARIIVADGKVAVRSTLAHSLHADMSEAIVTASTMALCSDSGTITLISGVPVDDYTAQYKGRLVFRATPLRNVVRELSLAYGVHIVVPDSLLGLRRVTFTTNVTIQPLSSVLDALSDVIGIHGVRNDTTVELVPGRRDAPLPRITPHLSPETLYGR